MGGTYSMYGNMKKCMQGVWWGNLKEGNHLQNFGMKIQEGRMWNGLMWLRIGTGGGLL